MKVLFISTSWALPDMCGAKFATRFRCSIFQKIYGEDNVDVLIAYWRNCLIDESDNVKYFKTFSNSKEALSNILSGNVPNISDGFNEYVIKTIRKNKYGLIVFDDSAFGKLSKIIRIEYPSIKMVALYHGTSKQLAKTLIKTDFRNLRRIPQFLANIKSEKMQSNIVDANVVLNKRDAFNFHRYNGISPKFLLPVCYDDAYSESKEAVELLTNKVTILFVGSHYPPNVEGIKWFASNVMPLLKNRCHLYVVGYGMEKYKNELCFKNNTTIVGTVKDLSPWYKCADLVVGPIFQGDGMKTKTAEALMYGKYFLGTKEALLGYEKLHGCECNTKYDFSNKIISYIEAGPQKYHQKYREIYEKYYSTQAAIKVINKMLISLNLE